MFKLMEMKTAVLRLKSIYKRRKKAIIILTYQFLPWSLLCIMTLTIRKSLLSGQAI